MSDSFAIPWTVPHQASQSMGFSRQEYWSGLPFPSVGDLPDPGIQPKSPGSVGGFFTSEPPILAWKYFRDICPDEQITHECGGRHRDPVWRRLNTSCSGQINRSRAVTFNWCIPLPLETSSRSRPECPCPGTKENVHQTKALCTSTWDVEKSEESEARSQFKLLEMGLIQLCKGEMHWHTESVLNSGYWHMVSSQYV